MRANPKTFGEAAITNRGNSGSGMTGEDWASSRTVSGETSNAVTADEIHDSCARRGARDDLGSDAIKFFKHFVGDAAFDAASEDAIRRVEIEEIRHKDGDNAICAEF